MVEFRSAHVVGPPDAGIGHLFLLADHLGLSGLQAHLLGEAAAFIFALERTLNRVFTAVHQGGGH